MGAIVSEGGKEITQPIGDFILIEYREKYKNEIEETMSLAKPFIAKTEEFDKELDKFLVYTPYMNIRIYYEKNPYKNSNSYYMRSFNLGSCPDIFNDNDFFKNLDVRKFCDFVKSKGIRIKGNFKKIEDVKLEKNIGEISKNSEKTVVMEYLNTKLYEFWKEIEEAVKIAYNKYSNLDNQINSYETEKGNIINPLFGAYQLMGIARKTLEDEGGIANPELLIRLKRIYSHIEEDVITKIRKGPDGQIDSDKIKILETWQKLYGTKQI